MRRLVQERGHDPTRKLPSFLGLIVKVLAGFLPIFLCLMPFEIYLRMNFTDFFEDKDIRRFHPFLQVVPLKNEEKLHINSHGFRADEIAKAKPEGVCRIFVMGGSTVFAGDMPYEMSHCAILEQRLKEYYPEKRIEVLNAGVYWHSTEHGLAYYLFKIKDYHPDLIIMWYGINDLYRSFSPKRFAFGEFQSDYSHFYGPVSKMVFQYFKPDPLVKVHLVSLVYLLRTVHTKISTDKLLGKLMQPIPISEFPSLKSFERNLISIAQIMRIDGVKLVLATEPTLYRAALTKEELKSLWMHKTMMSDQNGQYPSLESMIHGMAKFSETTRSIAQKFGVPLIDLDSSIPKSGEYLWDDCHYTAKGNELVAAQLFDFLVSHRLIE